MAKTEGKTETTPTPIGVGTKISRIRFSRPIIFPWATYEQVSIEHEGAGTRLHCLQASDIELADFGAIVRVNHPKDSNLPKTIYISWSEFQYAIPVEA